MTGTIDTLIIDDDHQSRAALYRLAENYPQLNVVGEARTNKDGYRLIRERNPELVFLNVDAPQIDGFNLIENFDSPGFRIICYASITDLAIQAIRYNFLDFLLKPLDEREMNACISRAIDKIKRDQVGLPSEYFKKIEVYSKGKVYYLRLSDVSFIQADGSYCQIALDNGERFVVSRNLKSLESSIDPMLFFRTHNSFLVNLKKVRTIDYREKTCTMDDGQELRVSTRKFDMLRQRLELVWFLTQ
ncbi:MAG: LytTR family DNA-binding domain-containing protein [Flavobacteriales bacterium]|nr:LytTR family DNA-binding domain-containing protein [Flavobacteriales bacterium]